MIVYLGVNHPLNHIRGVENVILAQSMASNNKFSYLIVVGKGAMPSVYRWGKLVVININKKRYWPLKFNYILINLKRRNPKLIIHSHSYLLSLFSIYKTTIFTVHDTLPYIMQILKRKKFYWRKIELIVYFRTKYLHFVSNYTFNYAKLRKNNKILIKHNTQVKNVYESSPEYKFNTINYKYALIVRSLELRADLVNLFDACNLIKKQLNLKFIVVGKGPLLNQLNDYLKNNQIDNVELVGYVDQKNLHRLYKDCEFTITTAKYGEGFGLPIIEGYSFGKEAIASDVCAIPEIIRDKKFLFQNTPEDIARSIKLVSNLKKEPKKILKYYEENYSLVEYIHYFKNIYSQVS